MKKDYSNRRVNTAMLSMEVIKKMIKKKLSIYESVFLLILGLGALLMLFPFYYVIILSLADFRTYANKTLYILPYVIDFSAYKLLFSNNNIVNSIIVTFIVTVVGTVYNMFMTTTFAYALSRKSLPGRRLILNLVIFTMFFGGTLISFFVTIRTIGLVNKLWVMIIPTGISVWYMLIMKNYFISLPESIGESARMDGANDIYLLVKIILPISAPVLASITLFYAVERWNEWWYAMMFISDTNLRPLQLILRETMNSMSANISNSMAREMMMKNKPMNIPALKSAIVVVTVTPILIVYPFIQKYFAAGIMVGSIKE